MRRLGALTILLLATSLVAAPADARSRLRPFDLNCGDTVPRSGRLAEDVGGPGDISDCNDDGLVIAESGITLDLDGHTIWADPDPFTFGILVTGNDVTIKNGVIRQFDVGVRAFVDGFRLKNVQVLGSAGNGIEVGTSGADTVLDRVTASEGAFHGVSAGGRRITITKSTFTGNGSSGVRITAPVAEVRTSDAHSNVQHGFSFEAAGRVIAVGNSASNNGITGMTVDALSPGSRIVRNELSGNATDGILLTADSATLEANVTAGNGESGIDADGTGNTFTLNRSTGNVDNGLFLKGNDQIVTENAANSNGAMGIRSQTGTGVRISRNVAKGNGFAIVNGLGLGIDATGAMSPVGRANRAWGNDDPDQCEPVTVVCTT